MFSLFHYIRFHFYFSYFEPLWNLIKYYYKIIGIRSSIIANCFKPLEWCFQLYYYPIKMKPACKLHFTSALRQLSFTYSLMHFYFTKTNCFLNNMDLHYLRFGLRPIFSCFVHFISLLVRIFTCLDFDLKYIIVNSKLYLPLLWDYDYF